MRMTLINGIYLKWLPRGIIDEIELFRPNNFGNADTSKLHDTLQEFENNAVFNEFSFITELTMRHLITVRT